MHDCHNGPALRPACVRLAPGHRTVSLIHMTITPAMRQRCLLSLHTDCRRGAGFQAIATLTRNPSRAASMEA